MSTNRLRARVPVPLHLRAGLRALQIQIGSTTRAIKILRCSVGTFEDAVVEGAVMRPEMIARLAKRLEAVATRGDESGQP